MIPKIKILKEKKSIYASKSFSGNKILEYTKQQENKHHTKCIMDNISWFGDLKEAKKYKTKNQHVYKWILKKNTNLLIMNKQNEMFFQHYFLNTHKKLKTTIQLTNKQINILKKKIQQKNIHTPYLNLSNNERAYYEFKFAYGYITLKEQYEFMKFIKFLINEKFVDIQMRKGKSIIYKLNMKIKYFDFFSKKKKHHQKYHRLSIYQFDKYALYNLCKIIPSKYKIDGVVQLNYRSFWFPDLIIYKMNIKEYVLYNPHQCLKYDKLIL
jgi:hypothetical protein